MLKLCCSFRFPWRVTSVAMLTVWLIGQFLKDRTWITGLMFYLPSPLAGLWLSIAAWRSWNRRQSIRSRCLLLTMPLLPLWFVAGIENQWRVPGTNPIVMPAGSASANVRQNILKATDQLSAEVTSVPQAEAGPMRLVHWNLGWPARRWSPQREILHGLNADFYLLSEISDRVQDQDFAGFQVLRRQHMLLACRGQMTASGSLVRYGVIQAFVVRCQLESCTVNLMIADVASSPSLPRNPYLQPMMQAACDRHADLIVGDMNAPRRSLAFSNMSGGFRHAYNLAGSGWSYTWPVPIPVLAIDQCICGPRIDVINYRLQSTPVSDHRLQVLDFVLNDDP